MKKFRFFKFALLCAVLAFLSWAFIIYPERYITRCFEGFIMWAECVLPSLFPLMVITLIFIKTGIAEKASLPLKRVTGIFGLPPASAVCFIISLCSGYPAGAKAVSVFYGNGCIGASDAKKLSALCSTSGPLFIIGSVGVKMLGDKSAGWLLLLAHAVSVLATGLIISLVLKRGEKHEYVRKPYSGNILYDCFYGAVVSVAVAGGFIAFFCVTAQIVCDFRLLYPLELLIGLIDPSLAKGVCTGLIEATAGCRELSALTAKLKLPFIGFLITFGGISILLQQLSYFMQAKVNVLYFTAVKFIQGAVCFLILLPFVQ